MTIVVLNADFEDSSKQINYGLDEALIYIGRTRETIKTNYASGLDELSTSGDIIFTDKCAKLHFKESFVNSNVKLELSDVTVLSIFKQEANGVAYLASNRNIEGSTGPQGGFSLTTRNTGRVGILHTTKLSDGTIHADSAYIPYKIGEFNFVCGRISPSIGETRISDLKIGASEKITTNRTTTVSHRGVVFGTSNEQKSGSNVPSIDCEIFMTVVIPSALSDIEIESVAEKMRLYASKYDITV